MSTIYALVFAVVVFGVLWGVGVAIGTLFHRNDASNQLASPAGVWTTRILWSEHGLTSGPLVTQVKKLTARMSATDRVSDTIEEDDEDRHWSDWGDLFSFFDEGFIWIAALAAVVALLASLLIMVVVAVELALLVLVGMVVTGLRAFRAHPWTIVVTDPLGAISQVRVKGIKNVRAKHQLLRHSIATGELTSAHLSDT